MATTTTTVMEEKTAMKETAAEETDAPFIMTDIIEALQARRRELVKELQKVDMALAARADW